MSQHVGEAPDGADQTPLAETKPGDEPAQSVFSRPYAALTWGVVLSVSMVAFESLGVATVLPGIARALHGLQAYGWGLSALMLANIVGTVVAGRSADRSGPMRPMAVGLVVFAVGCAAAGSAPDWPLFLAGRFLQGLGIGGVMAMAYTVIGLAFPEHLRARMFALLSSAWTVPSLFGPVVASSIAGLTSWRVVFVILIPLIGVAAAMTLPGLRSLNRGQDEPRPAPSGSWWSGALANALLLTVGTAVLLEALLLKNLVLLIVLGVVGAVAAVLALRRVTPEGTLSGRAGIGAGVAIRGLLCGAYFGSEAFLPLGLQNLRGMGATEAGIGLSAGAITWVLGSAVQAKQDGKDGKIGRTTGVAMGFAVLLIGVVVIALAVLTHVVPGWVAVIGWAIGGIGMGVAFNASTTDTLEQTPAERQGEVSGALQLAQTLATGVVAGLGGAAIAIAEHHDSTTRAGLTGVFALTAVLAALGVVLARRLRPAGAGAEAARP